MLEFSVQPAVFRITSRLSPFLKAADVAACLVVCAVKIDVSNPLFSRVPLIHRLRVCAVAALYGLRKLIKRLFVLRISLVRFIYEIRTLAAQISGFSLKKGSIKTGWYLLGPEFLILAGILISTLSSLVFIFCISIKEKV